MSTANKPVGVRDIARALYPEDKEIRLGHCAVYGANDRRMIDQIDVFDTSARILTDRFPCQIVRRPARLVGIAGCFYLLDRDRVIAVLLSPSGTMLSVTPPVLYRGRHQPCPFLPVDGGDRSLESVVEALKAYAWGKALWPEIRARIIVSNFCRAPLEAWVDMDGSMP